MHLLLVYTYTVFSVKWNILQFMFSDMLKHISDAYYWIFTMKYSQTTCKQTTFL